LDFKIRIVSVPGGNETQVAGLPERAPAFDYPVLDPFPSRGILLYPKTDYSTGYRPSLAAGDLTSAQWSYSSATGDKEYNRAFDANFSRDASPVSASGQPFVRLRIWGLRLADFAYAAPGPGSLDIAILVKVPGLTTWMDLGRPDGGGSSKQDVALDGAGCMVVGTETFDAMDQESRLYYSQVKANTGPFANLFTNTLGEAPVLVKVIIRDTAGGRALDFTQGGPTSDPSTVRGMVGVEVVRPS
jgi:hypothetical protein